MRARVAFCVVVGGAAGMVLYAARGFFPEHAFLVGIAISALTYSLLRAVDNLRSAPGHRSPGNQKETHDQ